jgi:hypothetical protein
MDLYEIVPASSIVISYNDIMAVPSVYSFPSHGNCYLGIRAEKIEFALWNFTDMKKDSIRVCDSSCYMWFKLNEPLPETVVFLIEVFLCVTDRSNI